MNNIDHDLIIKAKCGDKEALQKLIKLIQPKIYATLYYFKKNSIDLNDIVQNVLLKVSSKLYQLKNPLLFKTWLNQIIINTYYDFVRKNKKYSSNLKIESLNDDSKVEIPDYSNNPQETLLNSELDIIIKQSIQNLPMYYKIPITLREIQGLTYNEISKIAKLSVGTVKSRIARAREIIKQDIKRYRSV